MMKLSLGITFLLLGTTAPAFANAKGDAKAGKTKAAVCAACHGQNGISNNDLWPNLAGQKYGYLVKQLQEFKKGVRKDASMAAIINTLSDTDIKNLAAYYSSLKCN